MSDWERGLNTYQDSIKIQKPCFDYTACFHERVEGIPDPSLAKADGEIKTIEMLKKKITPDHRLRTQTIGG